MSIYKSSVCVCLGRQTPIKTGTRGAAVKFYWELHDEGPASGIWKQNRECKTQNSHTYTHEMMLYRKVYLIITHPQLDLCVYGVNKDVGGTSDDPLSPFPTFQTEIHQKKKKKITGTSIKQGQEASQWAFFFFPRTPSKHTKPFHCTHMSEVSDKHHHNHTKSREIFLVLSPKRACQMHTVSGQSEELAGPLLKIPPSVLLGLAWGRTWAQAYKCPLCSAVEMSNKWLFY